MINTKKINLLLLFVAFFCFSFGATAFGQITPLVQTNSATNIQNNSATINANLTDLGGYGNSTVYFQWGTNTGYGYQTTGIVQNYIGSFSQFISGLTPYTTYHFRAVAQNNYGTVYGQDMTFSTGQSNGSALTVNAGSDLYLTSGQTATLQGSGYDPSGYVLNYYWSCTGGTLSSYNIAQPVYTAPYAVNYNNQNYTCTLTVTNNYGNSTSDSMVVYMNNSNGGSGSNYVQTNYATYVSSSEATLNGSFQAFSLSTNYIYFQWGTTTNYGSQTIRQTLGSSGTFMQAISNLNSGTTYHFRAVTQNGYGSLYGQDMTFSTLGSNYYGSNNGYFSVNKQVMDISSGNLNWSSSVTAKPSDVLSFAITLQAGNQDMHNVIMRDILPANLIYKGNLAVNTNSNYGGDIASGINIGTIYANQATVVSYQVQVAASDNFSYGNTTLTNNATITSNESGTQTGSATVIVDKSLVYGVSTSDTASSVSTGLTNNFLTDSFFLPLLLLVAGLWFYFSGEIYVFADRLKSKINR